MNDALLGTTPHTYDFTWYGARRVMLRKEGYEQLEERLLLRAPWYFWIPLDLAMELWPFPVRDVRETSYRLLPKRSLPEPQPPSPIPEASTEPVPPSASTEGVR